MCGCLCTFPRSWCSVCSSECRVRRKSTASTRNPLLIGLMRIASRSARKWSLSVFVSMFVCACLCVSVLGAVLVRARVHMHVRACAQQRRPYWRGGRRIAIHDIATLGRLLTSLPSPARTHAQRRRQVLAVARRIQAPASQTARAIPRPGRPWRPGSARRGTSPQYPRRGWAPRTPTRPSAASGRTSTTNCRDLR